MGLQDVSKKEKCAKLNVWVTKHQKDFLKSKADIDGVSISMVTRKGIDLLENEQMLNTNIDKICEIIDMQIDRSFKKNLDRLIKLVVKGVISAESSNHNSAKILASIEKIDLQEVKDTAYHYAINYMQKKGGSD